MRLSTKETDSGYNPKAVPATIYVDGEELDHCHTADEELGVAFCYAVNSEGIPFIDPENPGHPKEFTVRGCVKIVSKVA